MTEIVKPKIIIITQYYTVNSDDVEYKNNRQKEVDYCLQKNFDNKYIVEIHFLLEKDYNLDFIKNTNNITIVKHITGKRVNYKDVFTYYNNNLQNNICVLLNSDIYLDSSIEIVKNIDFKQLFISLNRYENNHDDIPAFLNGIEIDEATYKGCQSFLTPFQASIWSQDAWIWKYSIDNINEQFVFELGTVGCDNYINYLMYNLGYKVLNCSRLICINHYDRLSIIKNEYGISKGNISKKSENKRVGSMKEYIFLENLIDIPDKYTTKIDNEFVKNDVAKILDVSLTKTISEIKVNNSQIIASSFSNLLCKPSNVLFNNESYWEPDFNDNSPFIQFNFENIYEIAVIDIIGKPLSINDLEYGYISKFKIVYCYNSTKWINDNTIYTGIEITEEQSGY